MNNLNKICTTEDWDDPEFLEMMQKILHFGDKNTERHLHRKYWEWTMGMLSIQKAGKLNKNCTFLGIGSGSEAPVFYLTNHVNYVFCTDLYSINSGKWKEGDAGMLANPERFASIQFNRRRLGVQIMSGTDIHFEDNTFDAVFSYSSIEHFGGKEAAAKCMKEIERVLKPGGVASIATEIFAGSKLEELYKYREKCSQFPHSLLRRHAIFSEMFTPEELETYLLGPTNMKPLYPIDFSINKEDLREAVEFPVKREYKKHIFLEMKGILWGSIHVALIKQ